MTTRTECPTPVRLLAAIMLVLTMGVGYTMSPHAAERIDVGAAAEDTGDAGYLASECVAGGLSFSDCLIDD